MSNSKHIKLKDVFKQQITGEWGLECETQDDGVGILRTTNFKNDGTIDFSNVVFRQISQKKVIEKRLRQGDIILEKSGGSDNQPVGRVVHFDTSDLYLCNNFTQILRPNRSVVKPKFVLYYMWYLHKTGVTAAFQNKTTGIRNLQTKRYLDFQIKVPSLEEQRMTVNTLDAVSEVLRLRKAQLAELDSLVKARFVEMFGDIHDSTLFPYATIDTFTTVTSGGTPDRGNSAYWNNGRIRWVKTTELQNCVIYDTVEKITQNGFENSSAKMIPAGSILIAMYGQGKTRGMTGYLAVECTTNQACACILPSKGINQKYLWQYMMLSYDKLRDMAMGGNQPNLNAGIIKKFPVLLPPSELQNEIAAFASQVDKSKVAVQKVLDETQRLFDSLMSEYFE